MQTLEYWTEIHMDIMYLRDDNEKNWWPNWELKCTIKIMVVTDNSHFVIFLVYSYSYTMINHTRDNCKSTYNYFGHIGGQLFLFEVYNKSSLC